MNPKVSLEKLQRIEEAIKTKFGENSVLDPRSLWNDKKEEEYQKQLTELHLKNSLREKSVEKVEKNGVLIQKHLFIEENETKDECGLCENCLLDFRDKTYINKFGTCFECFIQHVEGREEKYKHLLKRNIK